MQEFENALIEKLFANQRDAVAWYIPIYTDTGAISDFEIRYANQACEQFFQVPLREIIGTRVMSSKYFPRDNAQLVFSQCVNVWTTETTMQVSFYNSVFDRHLNIQRSKFANGVLTIVRDNTEVVKANEELQYQAGKLRSILDASLNGVIAARAVRDTPGNVIDFEIRLINKSFTSITGYTEEETIGKRFSSVFRSETVAELLPMYLNVIESGESVQKEIRLLSESQDRWFLVSIGTWGPDGVVQTFQEYTSMRELRSELEQTLKVVQQSNERLTEFTYVASHDLNEPLRKVTTFTKILADKLGSHTDPGVTDYMSRIVRTVERMQGMLDSLLVYSRASKQNSLSQRVNLNSVVNTVITELDLQLKESSAKVTIHNLPSVAGDSTQLTQVFLNLVSNSLKYRQKNVAPVISISRDEDYTDESGKKFQVITVKDNGIGFDQSEAEKIFQLFYRLHARHEYEGSGIGLAIVQRTIENHRGFVEAYSTPGNGAEFKLFFPYYN